MGGSFAARFIGVVLLAVTIGLASCQALLSGQSEPAAIASDDAEEGD